MSIRVYSRFLDLLFEIDRYQSLQYKRSYHGIGDFELHVNRYINGADTLEKGHLIALNKRNNKVGIILSKEIALDEGGKETENFKLTGYTLDGLMQRRITVPPSHTSHDRISGSAESVMKHYVYNNFINTESVRQMPFLEIADNQSRGEHIKYESRYKTVSDELENISISTGLGWGIFANFNTKKLIFDVIEAKDLTQGNRQGNNPVFFSPEFETIKSQEFIDSDHELRNVGFVGGQGEGVDRKIVKIGDAHGWDRIETFVDARDISDEDEESEEELTDEEVEELLIDRGKKKMSDMETIFTLEAEILTPTKESVYEYEKDFDLGDRVDVVNKSWNLKMTAPITELLEIYEPGGFRLEATFGRNRPTLISKLEDKFDELEGVEKQEAPERVSVTNLKEAKKYAKEQDEYVRKDAQDFADEAEEKSKEHTNKKDEENREYTDAIMQKAQREIDDTKARIVQAEKDLGEADKKVDKAVEDVGRLEKELEDLDLDFEIGGRNYVQNSYPSNDSIWYFSEQNKSGSHGIENGQLVIENNNNGWKQWQIKSDDGADALEKIEGGTEYTLSFEIKKLSEEVTGTAKADIRYQTNYDGSQYAITTRAETEEITNEWKRFYSHAVIPKDFTDDFSFLRLIMYFAGSGKIALRKMKIEKGNKATDWSPAPEDIQAEIDKANERINTANKDIKGAQDLIDSVTEDKNGQTVLKGTLITNELIAEDATLTGSFKGANATIDDLTTKNMTAINAIIQSAIIEGTLNAAKAIFKEGTFDKATIQDAIIKGTLGANDATMLGLTTEQMTAINATIRDATVTGSLNASDAIFQKGRFDEATIIDANIEQANIVDANLSGKLNIYRADGAVSMSDGMVRDGQMIGGINPMFMGNKHMDANGNVIKSDAFQVHSGYFQSTAGELDGRQSGYSDVRDGDYRSSIRIQRYLFVHSARYFVLTYRSQRNTEAGRGNLHRHLALIYDEQDNKLVDHGVPENTTETVDLIVDLGKPDFKNRWLDFRVGFASGWGSSSDHIRFRINNVVQTDFI